MLQRYPTTIHATDEIVAKIDMALDPALISSREAARNSSVSYVKGDIVADQLNTVFGPLGWGVVAKIGTSEDWQEEKNVRRNNEYVKVDMHMVMVVSDVTLTIKPVREGGTETVFTQPGIGYGEVEVGKSRKDAYGMAVKGAATDGLKRCASLVGKAFGMMMASNGSQEDIQYAHNGNANGLNKARGMRRGADEGGAQRGGDRQRDDGRGAESRPAQGRDDRTRETAEGGRSADAGRRSEPSSRRDDGPRHDATPRDAGAQRPAEIAQASSTDAQPPAKGATASKGGAARTGARRAATDFNLETLPVSQEEMTDFAATLVERVKELRQEGDRRSLVKQHINTIRNLDSKIRNRLVERLAEAGVEDDLIRA